MSFFETPATDVGMDLWDQEGVPHKGWRCTFVEDLLRASHTCEMCGKERIRYVHRMEHGAWISIQVGRICAEKMTDDYVNPKRRERELRSRAKRRMKWPSRWLKSAKDNWYIRRTAGVIVIFFSEGAWCVGSGYFESSLEAKLAVFDALYPRRMPVSTGVSL